MAFFERNHNHTTKSLGFLKWKMSNEESHVGTRSRWLFLSLFRSFLLYNCKLSFLGNLCNIKYWLEPEKDKFLRQILRLILRLETPVIITNHWQKFWKFLWPSPTTFRSAQIWISLFLLKFFVFLVSGFSSHSNFGFYFAFNRRNQLRQWLAESVVSSP